MSGTNLAWLLSWVVQIWCLFYFCFFLLHVLLSFLCVFIMPPLLKKGGGGSGGAKVLGKLPVPGRPTNLD